MQYAVLYHALTSISSPHTAKVQDRLQIQTPMMFLFSHSQTKVPPLYYSDPPQDPQSPPHLKNSHTDCPSQLSYVLMTLCLRSTHHLPVSDKHS
jgi:hypothetical protein